MPSASFFTRPKADWQRRYEALRASFVERLPARVVGERFAYAPSYVNLLRHLFTKGKIDLAKEPPAKGRHTRSIVTAETREKIREWRAQRLSAGDIAELLHEDGVEVSVSTVERVLAQEGFPKLPRRTRLKLGLTVRGARVPDRSHAIALSALDGQRFESASVGVFLFAPFLSQLGIADIVAEAGLPGTRALPATSYLLSFLALKLLGSERYSHVGEHAFDPGLGLFAGLNVLPKCTAMSTYSYGLDSLHMHRLQSAFVKRAMRLGLYDGKIVNLDFHTIPHFGDESVLEKHWAGARNRVMKGALTLFAQDAESKLMLYTDADVRRAESDDQVLRFVEFWKRIRRGVAPTLIFDARFTTYAKLSQLNAANVKFITLRRRGTNLLRKAGELEDWTRIHIPHPKRKYPNPQVHVSTITLDGYEGDVRQIIMKGNGREEPAFVITNDFKTPADLLVANYARRWRVENGIAEAVKFFNLNSLSSSILTKVHFDVALTMIADTLYTMLARKLRGFEDCDAPKLHRDFAAGKGLIEVNGSRVTVTFPRRAHNPVLRGVSWDNLPTSLPAPVGGRLELRFS
jgi:hypothetical protein